VHKNWSSEQCPEKEKNTGFIALKYSNLISHFKAPMIAIWEILSAAE
jgi:hypothetical protein